MRRADKENIKAQAEREKAASEAKRRRPFRESIVSLLKTGWAIVLFLLFVGACVAYLTSGGTDLRNADPDVVEEIMEGERGF